MICLLLCILFVSSASSQDCWKKTEEGFYTNYDCQSNGNTFSLRFPNFVEAMMDCVYTKGRVSREKLHSFVLLFPADKRECRVLRFELERENAKSSYTIRVPDIDDFDRIRYRRNKFKIPRLSLEKILTDVFFQLDFKPFARYLAQISGCYDNCRTFSKKFETKLKSTTSLDQIPLNLMKPRASSQGFSNCCQKNAEIIRTKE